MAWDAPQGQEASALPDDLNSNFFRDPRDPPLSGFDADSELGDAAPDPIAVRRMRIAAAEHRRKKLGKYVVGAVGASGLVCAIGVAKTVVEKMRTRSDSDRPAVTESSRLEPVSTVVAPRPSPAKEIQATAPKSTSELPLIDPAPEIQAEDPALRAKEALRLREVSRSALERGRVRDAIAAGENSVALDPADGEAWLVLGAAYQQAGSAAEARRCFRACVDRGTRGPRGECASMLR
jgi:tetratricopeptide (TPR) repeat protein